MKQILFPDPELADDDGLLAFGGDLEPNTLLQAYSSGIFPWSVRPISWWSPDPRAIFELDKFRLNTRMARLYRSGRFSFSTDKSFVEVMHGCARPAPGREKTWISPEFLRAYTRMHELGHAHSLEVLSGGKLVGGIYGIAIGGMFAGESMFSAISNASTMGLMFLINHLNCRGFKLFDSQVLTPHTSRLGAIEIPRAQYLARLQAAINIECKF